MATHFDWTYFNDAAHRYAADKAAAVAPGDASSPPGGSTGPMSEALPGVDAPMPAPSATFWTHAKATSLVVCATGVAIALVLFAYSRSFPIPEPVVALGAPTSQSTAPTGELPGPFTERLQQSGTSPTGVISPPVVNYTRFSEQTVGKLRVVSSWNWHSNSDVSPYQQGCYVDLEDPAGGANRQAVIAIDGRALPYSVDSMGPLTAEEEALALNYCKWFKLDTPLPEAPKPEHGT